MLKNLFKASLLAAALFVGMTGCKPDDNLEPDKIEVTPLEEVGTFSYLGESLTVSVKSTGKWSLKEDKTGDWVTPDKKSGNGNAEVVFTTKPNNEHEAQSATFTFYCGNAKTALTLTQEARPEDKQFFLKDITDNQAVIGWDTVTYELTLETAEDVEWTVTTEQEDLQGLPAGTQTGSQILTLNVPVNKTSEDKTYVLNFTTADELVPEAQRSLTFTLSQTKKPVHEFSVTTAHTGNIAAAGQTVTFDVQADETAAWTATVKVGDTVVENCGTSGTGNNSEVQIKFPANDQLTEKTYTVEFVTTDELVPEDYRSVGLTVKQTGAGAKTFSLSETSASVAWDATEHSLTVNAEGINWTLGELPEGLTVKDGENVVAANAEFTGTKTLTLGFTANAGDARQFVLTATTQDALVSEGSRSLTFTLSQGATVHTFDVAQTVPAVGSNLDAAATAIKFNVTGNASGWTVKLGDEVVKSDGSGAMNDVTVTVEANNTLESKTHTIVFTTDDKYVPENERVKTFEVTQLNANEKSFSLSATEGEVAWDAIEYTSLMVNASDDVVWTATADNNATVTVVDNGEMKGTKTLKIAFGKNESTTADNTYKVTVTTTNDLVTNKSLTFTLSQTKKPVHEFSVTTAHTGNIAAAGQTVTFDVQADETAAWTATVKVGDTVVENCGTSGTGNNSEVQIKFPANDQLTEKTYTVEFVTTDELVPEDYRSVGLTVKQTGAGAKTFSLSETSASVAWDATEHSLTVNAEGINWTLGELPEGLTVKDGENVVAANAEFTGTKTLTLGFTANAGDARQFVLTATTQDALVSEGSRSLTFTLSQGATVHTFDVAQTVPAVGSNLDAAATAIKFNVTGNASGWTVKLGDEVVKSDGSGAMNDVTVTVEANNTLESKTHTIVFTTDDKYVPENERVKTFEVTQLNANEKSFSLSATEGEVAWDAMEYTSLMVNASDDVVWTATADNNATVTVVDNGEMKGTKTLKIAFGKNESTTADNTYKVTVTTTNDLVTNKSLTFTLTQTKKPVHEFSVTTAQKDLIAAAGQTVTFDVQADETAAWTATVKVGDTVVENCGTSGTGNNSEVQIKFPANDQLAEKTYTVEFVTTDELVPEDYRSVGLTVKQTGAGAKTFSLSETSASVAWDATEHSLTVNAEGINWTLGELPEGLTVKEGENTVAANAEFTGTKTLTLGFTANAGDARQFVLTATTQDALVSEGSRSLTFTLSQGATVHTFDVAQTVPAVGSNLDAAATAIKFNVTGNASGWTVKLGDEVVKSDGTGAMDDVTVAVEANNTLESKTHTIVFTTDDKYVPENERVKTFEVTQLNANEKSFSLSATEGEVAWDAIEYTSLMVNASDDVVWTATADNNATVTVVDNGEMKGTKTLKIAFGKNESTTADNTYKVTVTTTNDLVTNKSLTFTLSQTKKPVHEFSVTTAHTGNIAAAGQTVTFDVQADETAAWTATVKVGDTVVENCGTSGTGNNSEVQIKFPANDQLTEKTYTVEFVTTDELVPEDYRSVGLTVKQTGAGAKTFSLSETSASVAWDATEHSLTVNAEGINWTLGELPEGLTVKDGENVVAANAEFTGTKTLTLGFTANAGDARQFVLTATTQDALVSEGSRSLTFTLTQTKKPVHEFSVIRKDTNGDNVTASGAEIKYSVVCDAATEWTATVKVNEGQATSLASGTGSTTDDVVYTILANNTLQDKTYTIVFTTADELVIGEKTKTYTVTQAAAAEKLEVTEAPAALTGAGGEVSFTVDTNLDNWTATTSDSWLTNVTKAGNTVTATASALNFGTRTGTITLQGGNLTKTVNVTQNGHITAAANMSNVRAQFADPDAAKNSQALKLGLNATFEALVKLPNSTSGINTIMGTESRFLLRYGDAANKLELVLARATTSQWGGPIEYKLIGTANMPTDRWIHVAATIESKSDYTTEIIIYIDGEVYASGNLDAKDANTSDLRPIDLSEREVRGGQEDNHFALGWSYDNGRFWRGLMSEVRVWNRALTQDELKAQNHFYTVPANSAGLVGYWKLNNADEGLKDMTSNGNDLSSQTLSGTTWNSGNMVYENL